MPIKEDTHSGHDVVSVVKFGSDHLSFDHDVGFSDIGVVIGAISHRLGAVPRADIQLRSCHSY